MTQAGPFASHKAAAFFSERLSERPKRPTRQEWLDWLGAQDMLTGHWPRAFGGQEWDGRTQQGFDEAIALSGAPILPAEGMTMAAHALIRFGSPAQQERYLPPMQRGEESWLISRGGVRVQSSVEPAVIGTPNADGYLLNGQSVWPSTDEAPSFVLALVSCPEGESIAIIDLNAPGVEREFATRFDGTRAIRRYLFRDIAITRDALIGDIGKGLEVAHHILAARGIFGPEIGQAVAECAALEQSIESYRERTEQAMHHPNLSLRRAALEARLIALCQTRIALIERARAGDDPTTEGMLLTLELDRLRRQLADQIGRAHGVWSVVEGERFPVADPGSENSELSHLGRAALFEQFDPERVSQHRNARMWIAPSIEPRLIGGAHRLFTAAPQGDLNTAGPSGNQGVSTAPSHPAPVDTNDHGNATDDMATKLRHFLARSPQRDGPWLWDQLADMGIFRALMPPEFGGTDGSTGTLISIFREIGRSGVTLPLLEHAPTGAQALALSGETEDLLDAVLHGEMRMTYAHIEPGSHYLAPPRISGEDDRLSGRKSAVPGGDEADWFIVSTTEHVYLLARDVPGMTRKPRRILGGLRAADLDLNNAPATPIGPLDNYRRALSAGLLANCAQMWGMIEHLTQSVVEAHKAHVPLPSGWPHDSNAHIISMLAGLQQAQGAVQDLREAMAQPDRAVRARSVAICKSILGHIGRQSADTTIRLLGPDTVTEEHPLSGCIRRLVVLDSRLGDSHFHLERLAGLADYP